MATLEDHQFELLGYAFGMDKPIFIDENGFDPGDSDILNQDTVNPLNGATLMGQDAVGAPEWVFTMHVDREDEPSALEELGLLRKAWANNGKGWRDPRDYAALRYGLGGRTRRVYGRPRRFTVKPDNRILSGYLPPVASFKLASPLHFDDNEQSVTMAMAPAETGGAVFPATFPLTFEREPDFVPASLMEVGGDGYTFPVVTFTGPVTNPSVQIGNVTIALVGTIGGPVGTTQSTVTIDTRPWVQTVTRTGNASGASVARNTRMNQCAIAPGTYSAAFRGVDTSGNSRCQVRWRNAWLTL